MLSHTFALAMLYRVLTESFSGNPKVRGQVYFPGQLSTRRRTYGSSVRGRVGRQSRAVNGEYNTGRTVARQRRMISFTLRKGESVAATHYCPARDER